MIVMKKPQFAIQKVQQILEEEPQQGQQQRQVWKQEIQYPDSSCFGCGEQGHIKADCPNNSKEKKPRHKEKKGKTKRSYIAWDENEVSSSSSSSEDERANICLIAEGDDESCSSSEISSCASLNEQIIVNCLKLFKKLTMKLIDWFFHTTDRKNLIGGWKRE